MDASLYLRNQIYFIQQDLKLTAILLPTIKKMLSARIDVDK